MLNEAKQPFIGHYLEILPVVDSSNNYAMQQIHDGKAVHGQGYLVLEQTQGKGRRGKSWYSGNNKNIALSIILTPKNFHLNQQFLLNAFVSVCLVEFLLEKSAGFKIKWPNDIYFHDRKAAGILIENKIIGQNWKFAVVGIGLNVNQESFTNDLKQAVSLFQITGKPEDLFELTKELLACFEKKWPVFLAAPSEIIPVYNSYLYKKDALVLFRQGARKFSATIIRVSEDGNLLCEDGDLLSFRFGEVEWLLPDQ